MLSFFLFPLLAAALPLDFVTVTHTVTSALRITSTVTVGLDSTSAPIPSATVSAIPAAPSGSGVSGRGTFYSVGADNCGTSSSDSDHVVAISRKLYSSLIGPNDVSGYCGKYIVASAGGNTVRVKVVDSCESCSESDLDFSPAAFEQLATLDKGVVPVEWAFE